MRCCDCEFRDTCGESEKVLTAFCSCKKRNRLLSSGKSKADEMFANMGYERCNVTENPISGVAAYRNFTKYGKEYRFEFTSGHSVFAYIDGELCGIAEDEIPAIAQVFKEMEVKLDD